MQRKGRQRIYKSEIPKSPETKKEEKSNEKKDSKVSEDETISSYALEDHDKPQYGFRPESEPKKREDLQAGTGTQGQVD